MSDDWDENDFDDVGLDDGNNDDLDDEYLDEEILGYLNRMREEKEKSIETGAYVNGEWLTFKRQFFFDGKLSLILPESFVELPPDLAKLKYPSSDRPQIILSNIDGTVNFTFSCPVENEMQSEFCPQVRDYLKLIIERINPSNEVIDASDIKSENTPISLFRYLNNAVDMRIYNVSYVTVLDGYAMMGTFNCPNRERSDWETIVQQSLTSIRDETIPIEEKATTEVNTEDA